MDFVASFDPILRFAFWSGVAACALALFLVFQVVMMRFMLNIKKRRKDRVLSVWRPLMVQSLAVDGQHYPAIAKADIPVLLNLWNHFQESLRGGTKQRLSQMARDVAMDKMAHAMLGNRSLAGKLLAMMTLGHLRDHSALPVLTGFLKDESPIISLAAARALMQIDDIVAVEVIMPLLAEREDWPSARVASLLKEAGAAVISTPLSNVIRLAPVKQLPRLIHFLELTYSGVSSGLVREILEKYNEPQVVSACLLVMSDSRDLDLVRKQLQHPDWPVRVQAAAALGRMGTEVDRQSLVKLLEDPQWWVRYRAAQSLSKLPFVTLSQLQLLQEEQTDPYARDMLKQIIAERRA